MMPAMLKLMQLTFKNLVCASKKTQYVSMVNAVYGYNNYLLRII
jgi:hypothetical protein